MISATIVVTTLAVMACIIFPLALSSMNTRHAKALALKDEYYKDLKEENKELRKKVVELREIASTHEIKPVTLEPIITKNNILDGKWFTCHPSKLVGLLEPFVNSIEDADTFDLTINGLNGNQDSINFFTAKTSSDLITHLDHTLSIMQTLPDTGSKLVWKHANNANFKVKLDYTKKVMPTEPQIHYVKVLETDAPAAQNNVPAAAIPDKEYLEALIELAVEEKLNKNKLAGQTQKVKL